MAIFFHKIQIEKSIPKDFRLGPQRENRISKTVREKGKKIIW